jgi:hypothetical protein
MKSFAIVSLLCVFSCSAFSQTTEGNYHANIVLKMTPLPFLLEFVYSGRIKIANDSLFFNPLPCTVADKKSVGIFPCVGNQIKPMALSFSEIKKIKNRAYLFFIPNRLLIVTKNNEGYLFGTYRRRKIRQAYTNYLMREKTKRPVGTQATD